MSRKFVRLGIAGAVTASLVVCTSSPAVFADRDQRAYLIKAAFLKHFAAYVTWPE